MNSDPVPAAPAVKATPDFKKGETVRHQGEGTKHKILELVPHGKTVALRLEGIANLVNASAVEKL